MQQPKGATGVVAIGKVKASEKHAKAAEMRVRGCTLEQIADELGYKSRASAHKAIEAAMLARKRPAAEALAQMHMARLEAAAEPIMQKLTRHLNGEPLSTRALGQATSALVRVLSQQARYVDVYAQGQGLGPVVSLLAQLLEQPPAGVTDPDDPMTIDADVLELDM